ncbi:MAG TPA: RHS repeat-associated core domain-containing protein, partial [Ilumatobacteraceae bacterium]
MAGFITAASASAMPPFAHGEPKSPGAAAEGPDDADFRVSQVRVPALDAATTNILTNHGVNVASIDPPGMTATPAPGHKIGSVTPTGGATRTLDYGGKSELIDDGIFLYNYNVKGRLVWTMEKPATAGTVIRRIRYDYDSRNRLVGRTAEAASVPVMPVPDINALAWQTESRDGILAEDGLPAETTFIWDPVADRLMTIVRAGASFVPNDPNANIVKQFIHGEMGYDDPIRISMIDTTAPHAPGTPAPVKSLYPVYDEAAGGSLQVVLNNAGEIVARSITTDPYGGARFDLSGGAIDHVEITGSKDAGGTLQSVKVAMRSTEQLASPSLSGGTRLSVVDANGTVLRTSTATPALDPNDPFTVTWTLTASDWTTLSDPTPVAIGGVSHAPASLSIAATSSLRASVWAAETKFLPAPAWATASKPVFSSSTLPIEVRESLANVTSLISSLQPGETRTNVSYDIPNLSLTGSQAGDPSVAALFASSFQAQPFTEPFTHKVYVRERWYDPTTGTWLSPDPMGYRDSSNLYAYAGGDPVNRRDPTGECGKGTMDPRQCAAELQALGQKVDDLWDAVTDPGREGREARALDRRNVAKILAARMRKQGVQVGPHTPVILPTHNYGLDASGRLLYPTEGAEDASADIVLLATGLKAESAIAKAAIGEAATIGIANNAFVRGSMSAARPAASRLGALGELIDVNVDDEAADALAERIGGRSSVKFEDGPANEFDAVSE